MSGALELTTGDLVVSALLVLMAGGVSFVLRLEMERRLAWAALRTVVQLLLVGFVLRTIFGWGNVYAVSGMALAMVAAAGREAVRRATRRYAGVLPRAFLTLVLCGFVTTLTVTRVVIGVDPWYRPQYLIPLLGMVLGNGLTGISLCLDGLLESLSEGRDTVEMELAHGATAWEAARRPLADAVRRGMIPIVNSMMVVGIVAFPGMMTGQILAGADPLLAVKYQIVVMFMVAGGTSLGCMLTVLLAFRALFNSRHQLRAERIRANG